MDAKQYAAHSKQRAPRSTQVHGCKNSIASRLGVRSVTVLSGVTTPEPHRLTCRHFSDLALKKFVRLTKAFLRQGDDAAQLELLRPSMQKVGQGSRGSLSGKAREASGKVTLVTGAANGQKARL